MQEKEDLQEEKEKVRNKGLQKPRSTGVPLEGEPNVYECAENTFEKANSNRFKWRQRTMGRESVAMTKEHERVLTRFGKGINRWISNL